MEKYKEDEFGNVLLPEVVSTGISGKEWIPLLEEKECMFGGVGSSGSPGLSKSFFESRYFESTKGVNYQPIVVMGTKKDESEYLPNIQENYLSKGYRLAPMEVFALLCNEAWFFDFLKEAQNRMVCDTIIRMHEPYPYPRADDYQLSLWMSSKKIEGVYSNAILIRTNYLFIFIK